MTDTILDPSIASLGLNTRVALAAAEIGPITKDERNKEQAFNFRSIETITGRVRQVFAKYGISVRPTGVLSIESEPVESKRGAKGYRTVVVMSYSVGCDVWNATTGTWIKDTDTMACPGEAVDYGDKSTSKAVQMAYKYALTEALTIGDKDADADSEGHELATEPEQMRPAQRLAHELDRMAEGDVELAREWAISGAKALGFVGKWAENDENVDRVLEWAKQTKRSGYEPTVVREAQKEGPTQPFDASVEQWSALHQLLDSDPALGTREDIEKRTRQMHALMRAVGVWLDGDGMDPFHTHLMEWYGVEHWGDLKNKANMSAFAEKSWTKAKNDVTTEGKDWFDAG